MIVRRLLVACVAALVLAGVAVAQSTANPIYLPLLERPAPTTASTPTPAPAVGPSAFCVAHPVTTTAPNYPIIIDEMRKFEDSVVLRNVSGQPVAISTKWHLCSTNGNEEVPLYNATIQPGAYATANGDDTSGEIWNDNQRDDAALFNDKGILVAYLTCDDSDSCVYQQ